jgi:cytochrome c biogenesis protein CcmG, thiol:disulfide interchange protein DsbE
MKRPNRFIVGLLGVLGFAALFLGTKAFLNTPRSINYADKLEYFQSQGVPDFQIPLFDPHLFIDEKFDFSKAQSLRLSDVKAKVILINFWATWCEPCQDEFPSLVELSQRYAHDERLKIIAVSTDEDTFALRVFLTTGAQPSPKNFLVGVDSSSRVAEQFGTKKIPETYIIDGRRKLLRKILDGQNWTTPEFIKFLDSLLNRENT